MPSAPDSRFLGVRTLTWPATSSWAVGDQLKVGSSPRSVAVLGTSDSSALCIGTAVNSGVSGESCSFVPAGEFVVGQSDGTAAIVLGDALGGSTTTAGKVKTVTTGVAFARALSAVANGVSGDVDMLWMGGSGDTSATSTPTLAQVYAAGSAAADQKPLIQSGKGGQVVFKANGLATGSLVEAQTSAGTILFQVKDNDTQTLASSAADGASAVGAAIDVNGGFSTAGAKVLSLRNGGVECAYVQYSGKLISQVCPSIVDLASQMTVPFDTGDFTYGDEIVPLTNLIISGLTFWWPGGLGAKSVKASLWNLHTTTRLANATVSVNAAGAYTATLTPQTLTAGRLYAWVVYETSGGKAVDMTGATLSAWSDGGLVPAGLNGIRVWPGYYRVGSIYSAGDIAPASGDVADILGCIDPIIG